MSDATELSALLASQQKPVCASLTPFEVADADFEAGFVELRFAEQPAFSNHWGGRETLLVGSDSADVLDGGAGNDTLVGGHGNDIYVWGRGAGADTLRDVDSTPGNIDKLLIGAGVSMDQLWFRHVGDDLEVSIIGTSDKVTVDSWYLGSEHRLEQFATADGRVLVDTTVQNLVNAMASFAPPAAGQTTLPEDYRTALNPVLAASWQG